MNTESEKMECLENKTPKRGNSPNPVPAACSIAILSTALAMSTFLTGCANGIHQRSQKLQLDMPRDRVVKTIGHRHSTVAARKEGDSGRVEVLRFSDKRGNELLGYFRDGKLVQWGDSSALQNMPQ